MHGAPLNLGLHGAPLEEGAPAPVHGGQVVDVHGLVDEVVHLALHAQWRIHQTCQYRVLKKAKK